MLPTSVPAHPTLGAAPTHIILHLLIPAAGTLAEREPDEVYKRAGLLPQSEDASAAGSGRGAGAGAASSRGGGGSREITCMVCMSDVAPAGATTMECGHTFCNDCWREHMRCGACHACYARFALQGHHPGLAITLFSSLAGVVPPACLTGSPACLSLSSACPRLCPACLPCPPAASASPKA